MTPEKLEKKRETARKNGAKSRGPVTDAGKQAAKQNSLRHGRYVDRSLMPPNYVLLSQEVQEGFAQELKDNTRQFQVATETQAKIVRQLTAELWMYNRLGDMLCALDQQNFDKACRDYPDYSNIVKSAYAAHNSGEMDKVYRQIERRRAGHLKAWATLCKMVTHLQKHHSQAVRDPEVRNPVQAQAQLEVEAERWNEPIEEIAQPIANTEHTAESSPERPAAKLTVLDNSSRQPKPKTPVPVAGSSHGKKPVAA